MTSAVWRTAAGACATERGEDGHVRQVAVDHLAGATGRRRWRSGSSTGGGAWPSTAQSSGARRTELVAREGARRRRPLADGALRAWRCLAVQDGQRAGLLPGQVTSRRPARADGSSTPSAAPSCSAPPGFVEHSASRARRCAHTRQAHAAPQPTVQHRRERPEVRRAAGADTCGPDHCSSPRVGRGAVAR